MATYVFPDWLHPDLFGMRPEGNVKINESPMNRAVQRVEFPGDFWVVRAEFPPIPKALIRRAEAFFNQFRGGYANTLRIWDLSHPIPAGTMRGSPTCAAANEGANQITISTTSGATLEAGDNIGVTLSTGFVQLCQVTGAETVGSTITANITPPLRRSVTGGASIVWNKPTVDCVIYEHPFIALSTGGVSEEFEFKAREIFV